MLRRRGWGWIAASAATWLLGANRREEQPTVARRKYNREINLPAPYLKRIWIDAARISNRADYPFPEARLLRVTKYGLEP